MMIDAEKIREIFYNASEEGLCCERCKWLFKDRVEKFIKETGVDGVDALVSLVGEEESKYPSECSRIVWALAEIEDSITLAKRIATNRAFLRYKSLWVIEEAVEGVETLDDLDCEEDLRNVLQVAGLSDFLLRSVAEQVLDYVVSRKKEVG